MTGEEARAGQLGANEWWLPRLADELRISVTKLREWVVKGWVLARKTPGQNLWVIRADAGERKRLRELSARSKQGVVTHPVALTTPRQGAARQMIHK